MIKLRNIKEHQLPQQAHRVYATIEFEDAVISKETARIEKTCRILYRFNIFFFIANLVCVVSGIVSKDWARIFLHSLSAVFGYVYGIAPERKRRIGNENKKK